LIAPSTLALFSGTNFSIGQWEINEDNSIGLFLAIINTILWIACYFCMRNLTIDPSFQYVKDEIFTKDKIE